LIKKVLKDEHLTMNFFDGMIVAMLGLRS